MAKNNGQQATENLPATTEQKAVATKINWGLPAQNAGTLRGALDAMKSQIAMALPKHLDPDRMIRIAVTAVSKTPKLMQCSLMSLAGCIIEAAQLGLEVGGALGEAYLVPFFNSKTGKMECQFMPGYQGLMKLARQSGQIAEMNAEVVFEKDHFVYRLGKDKTLEHIPCGDADPGPVKCVYADAHFKDGGYQPKVLWPHDVEKVKRASKAAQSGPWKDWPEEMMKKTALKRLCKMLPKSTELERALELDNHFETGSSQTGMIRDTVNQFIAITDDAGAESEARPTLDALAESASASDAEPAGQSEIPMEG